MNYRVALMQTANVARLVPYLESAYASVEKDPQFVRWITTEVTLPQPKSQPEPNPHEQA